MKKITIDHKEFTMEMLSIDAYGEYLDIAEKIDSKPRYSSQDLEVMGTFICKAYGNQFTYDELKDPEKGLDPAGLIMEFQSIDMAVADELTKRMENLIKNIQTAS